MQRRLQPLRGIALRFQRAVGQEARAVQRDLVLQSCPGPVLDELDRAAAGKEHEHGIRLERSHLGDQRLEFDVGERQAQLLHHLAALGLEGFLEALHGLLARRVLPRQRDHLLHAALGQHLPHGVAGLPVRERGTEDVGPAQRPGGLIGAGVRDDQQRVVFLGHLDDAHLHARMHRAHHHVHLVPLDQLGGVLGGLGRVRFVIHLEVFDVAPAQLAALLLHIHAEPVLDGRAQRRVGAGVRQHEAHLDLGARGGLG
ncbi:hypothetical protein D3C72_1135150 [compost metagenome]